MNLPANHGSDTIRQQLLSRATGLTRQAQRIVFLRAWVLSVTFIIGVSFGLMAVDIALRREELGLRILLWISLAMAIAFAVRRWLLPAFHFTPNTTQLAAWLRVHHPQGNALATAIQLATIAPHEIQFGSRSLQDKALRLQTAKIGTFDWESLIDRRQLHRASALLVTTILCALIIVALFPAHHQRALQRLLLPLSKTPWPRSENLVFRNFPAAVAGGQDFQLEVADLTPPFPDQIFVQVRSIERSSDDSPNSQVETITTKYVGDLAVANLTSSQGSIEVRAVGGDDYNMPWQTIEVVQAPTLNRFSFLVSPPKYTGHSPKELIGKSIQVLANSELLFRGEFDQAVNRVWLRTYNQGTIPEQDYTGTFTDTITASDWSQWQVHLAEDGKQFTVAQADGAPLPVTASVRWNLMVETESGLELAHPDSWEVEVISDQPPSLALDPPPLNILATDSQISLKGSARDDLGFVDLRAVLSQGDSAIPLSENQDTRIELPIWHDDRQARTEMQVATVWNLEESVSLAASKHFTVWLEAIDELGQIGRSNAIHFDIKDSDEVIQAIENRQHDLLNRIRALLENQLRSEQLIQRASEVAQQVGEFRQSETDALAGGAQLLSTITTEWTDETQGIMATLSQSAILLAQNNLHTSPLGTQLDGLLKQARDVENKHLPDAVQTLEQTRQVARLGTSYSSVESQINQNSASQHQLTISLENLESMFAEQESAQQVQRQLRRFIEQQRSIADETQILQFSSTTASPADDSEATKFGIISDQSALARQAEEFAQSSNSLALSSQAARAGQSLRDDQVSTLMRQTKQQLRDNDFVRAIETQQKLVEAFRHALEQISNSSSEFATSNLSDSLEQLRLQQSTLADLTEKQAALADAMRSSLSQDAWQLSNEQTSLKESVVQISREALDRGDGNLADQLAAIANTQQAAADTARRELLADASRLAQQAAQDLSSAARDLQDRAQSLTQEISQQRALDLRQTIVRLLQSQMKLIAEMQALADRAAAGEISLDDPSIDEPLQSIANRQDLLSNELRNANRAPGTLPTLNWLLQSVEDNMTHTVAAVQHKRLRPEAIDSAEVAVEKLQLASQILAEQTNLDAQTEADASDNKQDSEDSTSQDPVLGLKLLRGLQMLINDRTIRINADETLDPIARSQQISRLAAEQQSLAEQVQSVLTELKKQETTSSTLPDR
ncbi:MAG: hypothetical protein KDB03_02825 [Planctomycetales bacterium]|nr:hypothetical protein [Planctomycetales bacterium]